MFINEQFYQMTKISEILDTIGLICKDIERRSNHVKSIFTDSVLKMNESKHILNQNDIKINKFTAVLLKYC